jgi:hypothetical protein
MDRSDRPGPLGLHPSSSTVTTLASMSSLSLADLPSPRAGEAPPALSPLDALALQGRLLAKRFEQADKSGRRLSRLAPLTIQNEFGNRPGYFSSLSAINSPNNDLTDPAANPPDVSPRQIVADKHRSHYPVFGSDEAQYAQSLSARSPLAAIGELSPASGYFDIPRSQSPESDEPRFGVHEATPVSPAMPIQNSRLFLSPQRKPSSDSQRKPSSDSQRKPSSDSQPRSQPRSNLLPPRSSSSQHSQRSPRLSPSLRSTYGDESDEADDTPMSTSYDSLPRNRNVSISSNLSRAQSPFTLARNASLPRSPSAASDYSVNGGNLPRPAFNFSRPISRQSTRPSIDVVRNDPPTRQHSDESVFMRPSMDAIRRQDSIEASAAAYANETVHYANETVHTPVSMASEDFRRSGEFCSTPGPTYTYAKFDLPRGRKLDRKSIGIEDFFKKEITWDHPNGQKSSRPPSPESPPRSFDQTRGNQARTPTRDQSAGRPSLTSSNSTVRGRVPGTPEVTAQEHCDKGVQLHEAGELLKSTYHFRLAARAGLAEGMFWYGLACRHGWGMRENKAEALQWLRRAVDSGHLEIADDESQPTDVTKKKQHKAQYAVAIYELGKCYMNGWGTAKDKSLALRCYEIAGNWGDADALVEAGYCYAEGVGCHKNMKKAAKFYRAAESKGVSMVGNSW